MQNSLVPDETVKRNRNFRPEYVHEMVVERKRNVSKEKNLKYTRRISPNSEFVNERS